MVSARLQTTLGTLQLTQPIICGSGEHVMTAAGIRAALAAGVAGVVAKSVNESRDAARQLQRAAYAVLEADGPQVASATPGLRPAASSILCRSGLVNVPPAEWFSILAELDREAIRAGQFVAASIVLADPHAAVELAAMADAHRLRILELNLGAPHGREAPPETIRIETDAQRVSATTAAVRARFSGQLWVKLTSMSDNPAALAVAACEGGADAVGLSGRFMGLLPDLETRKPLLGTAAAYGGQWALPITCRALALARRVVGAAFPLIGTNGARTGLDVARFLLAGAHAVEMASIVFLRGFTALTQAREELSAWLAEHDMTVEAAIGNAADALQSYAEQPEQGEAWRRFVPSESL